MKITEGGGALFHSLTSPPPKPHPMPSPELVGKVVQYGDREVIVTIPFPDTIELITDVLNEHFVEPFEAGSAKAIYTQVDEALLKIVHGYKDGGVHYSPSPQWGFGAKAFVIYKLPFDPKQPLNYGRLELRRKTGTNYATWSVRLEFSPSKAGPSGLVQLIARIEDALPLLNFAPLLKTFRLSRVDAAVDCIGVTPIDLIAHIAKSGKRTAYIGDGGHPESLYLFARKTPLEKPPSKLGVRTMGPTRLVLYDRRSHAEQLCLPLPYGDCPVTRAEVSIRWKKSRPLLSSLPHTANLFAGRRVAYAPTVGSGTKQWQRFCLAAFGGGVDAASYAWLPGPGGKMRKLYRDCPGDLVDEGCWTGWIAGIASTGLANWISY